MAGILWLLVLVLVLLSQGCRSSPGQTEVGCKIWRQKGADVCCDECYPGNRLVRPCGPDPKALCKPCESGTFTLNPREYRCTRCTQCIGAQVHVKDCTIRSDTQCGCKDGLVCGNERCSFCVEKCAKGYERAADGSCRPCPDGSFNNGSFEKCKPWSTSCRYPHQEIVAKGNASSDIQCVTISSVNKPNPPGTHNTDKGRPTVLYEVVIAVLMAFVIVAIVIIITTAVKITQKRKKSEKKPPKTPIVRTPTDEPRTLIAIECSFHEAQQEQGSSSSTESLIKEPSEELSA
ncbi:tumor necrosis factor receptor superfamily member 9a [Kryptolebias marmoratus]|uniref:Tumor necrosis factor receptor superfamily, member 9a n=1 Tax=Kryptolebias marmoratus TaxID=37003 RepID=A0A3Q3F906_KRYMA|nr:tumor necrosis factor receptor superfamily member 9a [Kryptolebias marmoratus]XP_037832775.1 tumor necrosis factor receptor superfamily member 9a [Kryptolebias marmoratus]